jgi:hypothetical protein
MLPAGVVERIDTVEEKIEESTEATAPSTWC